MAWLYTYIIISSFIFFHHNYEYLKGMNLNMVNEKVTPLLLFKWCELFLRRNNNANFGEFTNKFMKIE